MADSYTENLDLALEIHSYAWFACLATRFDRYDVTHLRGNFNCSTERGPRTSKSGLLRKVKGNAMLAGLSYSCKYLDWSRAGKEMAR